MEHEVGKTWNACAGAHGAGAAAAAAAAAAPATRDECCDTRWCTLSYVGC